jgi:type IV fimbrial biogenesis protein FimT
MNRHRGFTLIELMVVIAVAAILMMVAVPNLRSFVQNNRITGTANQIHASLSLARAEALKRQLPGVMEALSSAGAANEFGGGWFIYTDVNSNGSYAVADDGPIVSRVEALPGGTTVDAGGSGATVTRIVFTSSGISPTQTLQMRIPACKGPQGRDVSVSNTGRISIATVGC